MEIGDKGENELKEMPEFQIVVLLAGIGKSEENITHVQMQTNLFCFQF